MSSKIIELGKNASLFLDRDGVINTRLVGDYVTKPEQFELLPGVAPAMKKFRRLFGHIFVVTNQQGIGKGLMTHEDLDEIHAKMIWEMNAGVDVIDRIYYCPYRREEGHIDRKPNVGMGLKARKEFGIQLKKAVIVGDSLSDMEFGRKLGMRTVFISTDQDLVRQNHQLIDYWFSGLKDFADSL